MTTVALAFAVLGDPLALAQARGRALVLAAVVVFTTKPGGRALAVRARVGALEEAVRS